MLRHGTKERTRSAAQYNNETWKTKATVEETAAYLLSQDEFSDSLEIPLENEDWIELYEMDDGRHAVMSSEKGDFQVSIREYENDWKKTDADLTYFHHPNRRINRIVEKYMEDI